MKIKSYINEILHNLTKTVLDGNSSNRIYTEEKFNHCDTIVFFHNHLAKAERKLQSSREKRSLRACIERIN